MRTSRALLASHDFTPLAAFRSMLCGALLLAAAGGKASDFVSEFGSLSLAVPDGSPNGTGYNSDDSPPVFAEPMSASYVPGFGSLNLAVPDEILNGASKNTKDSPPLFPGTTPANFVAEFGSLNLAVPDGSLNGVSDTRIITSVSGRIAKLQVTLTISGTGAGGYNGDLYVTLVHGSGYSVLLNRPGRRTDSLLGYADNGLFEVTFDDAAVAGDFHSYRLTLAGDQTTPLQAPLTGIWSPDGRTTDPDSVLLDSPRTAMLNSFDDLEPNGSWTLFIADLESGGTHRVDSWGLQITTVPEPSVTVLGAAGLLFLALATWKRRRPSSGFSKQKIDAVRGQ